MSRVRSAVALGFALWAAAAPACAAREGRTPGEPVRDEPALVFAAASLADVLTEAAAELAAEAPGARIDFNFAGSSVLAQQIFAGAPADLFVSADRRQVARLVAAGEVEPGEPVVVAGNRLVVVTPAAGGDGAPGARAPPASLAAPRDLLAFRRLALADPAAVPAGVYAREWLEREGLWDELAPRVVPALDVRAALAAVAAGHLDAGIVYATDARSTARVRVVYRVPPGRGPAIEYVAARLAGRGDSGAADTLLAFLRGPEGRALLARHGFEPPPHEAGGAGHGGPGGPVGS